VKRSGGEHWLEADGAFGHHDWAKIESIAHPSERYLHVMSGIEGRGDHPLGGLVPCLVLFASFPLFPVNFPVPFISTQSNQT